MIHDPPVAATRPTRSRRRFALLALGVIVIGALAMFGRFALIGSPPAPRGSYTIADTALLLPGRNVPLTRVHVWRPRATSTAASYPIVLFAPGWLGYAADNALLLAELASRGYIVVAFDDVAHDPATPDETPAEHAERTAVIDLSSDAAFERGMRAARTRTGLEMAKCQRVLDGIQLRASQNDPLFQDADPQRIGFLGFSFGGFVGLELAARDARITAVINLDGRLFGDGPASGPSTPYLLVSSTQYLHETSDFAAPEAPRRITARWSKKNIETQASWLARPNVYWFAIDDSLHEDFMDVFFRPHWRAALRRRWKRRVEERTAIDDLIGAFFETYLRDRPSAWLQSGAAPAGTRRVLAAPR